jgi:ribosomal protein L39E
MTTFEKVSLIISGAATIISFISLFKSNNANSKINKFINTKTNGDIQQNIRIDN